MFDCVRHQKQVHWHDVFHLDAEHAINSRNNTVRIILEMLKVRRQCFKEDLDLVFIHGLDDELLVVREEEKAAGFALGLAGLERLVPVALGRERELNLMLVNVVHLSDLLELQGRVFVYGHLLVNGQHGCNRSGLIFKLRCVCIFLFRLPFLLNESVTYKVLELRFVPFFWILDFNPVEPTNAHLVKACLLHLFEEIFRFPRATDHLRLCRFKTHV